MNREGPGKPHSRERNDLRRTNCCCEAISRICEDQVAISTFLDSTVPASFVWEAPRQGITEAKSCSATRKLGFEESVEDVEEILALNVELGVENGRYQRETNIEHAKSAQDRQIKQK